MRGYWKCRAETGPPLAQKNQGLGELPNPLFVCLSIIILYYEQPRLF
jgi:hypothetical protein